MERLSEHLRMLLLLLWTIDNLFLFNFHNLERLSSCFIIQFIEWEIQWKTVSEWNGKGSERNTLRFISMYTRYRFRRIGAVKEFKNKHFAIYRRCIVFI